METNRNLHESTRLACFCLSSCILRASVCLWLVGVGRGHNHRCSLPYRMFAITGFFDRYFSHRTFKTSRGGQFVFAVSGGARRCSVDDSGGPPTIVIITVDPTKPATLRSASGTGVNVRKVEKAECRALR